MVRAGGATTSAIRTMVGMVPCGVVGRFLAAELRKNPAALDRFARTVRAERKKKMQTDYRAATSAMMKRAAGRKGYIDRHSKMVTFAKPTKDAKDSEKLLDYAEAARIYAEVYEAIEANIGYVYSGIGVFRDQARKCAEGMSRCARATGSTGVRRAILSRLLRMWTNAEIRDYTLKNAAVEGIVDPGDATDLVRILDSGKGGGKYYALEEGELRSRLVEVRRNLEERSGRRGARRAPAGAGAGGNAAKSPGRAPRAAKSPGRAPRAAKSTAARGRKGRATGA